MALHDRGETRSSVQPRAMAAGGQRSLTEAEITHFDLVAPSTARRARLACVRVLPPGAAGMAVGRWVLLRAGHERRHGLIAHELVHVEQWLDAGWWRFLARYLADYVARRRAGLSHRAAYLAIPAEEEARQRAEVWSASSWL